MITICEKANYDLNKVKNARKALDASSTEISNVVGWIISAIENGYQPISRSARKKSTGFDNFESHGYDYKMIQDMLISQNFVE